MGLDVTAYEFGELTEPHERTDDCWEADHVWAFVYKDFERSLRGLEPNRCYRVSGRTESFRAGSYGGYGLWRAALCHAALGVDPDTVWGDPAAYADRPFFELVNFADNEGTIGPEACTDLAADFAALPHVRTVLAASGMDPWFADKFDAWASAFRLAGGKGLVRLA